MAEAQHKAKALKELLALPEEIESSLVTAAQNNQKKSKASQRSR